MSDISGMLSQDERIVYETQLSGIIFTPYLVVGLIATIGCAVGAIFVGFPWWLGMLVGLLAFLILVIMPVLTRQSSEFAVTTKRVIMKTGILSRSVFEMRLEKVESIDLFQSFLGRMGHFGTIVIHGTGDTAKEFADIADPMKFKQAVLDQQERRGDASRHD